MTRDEAVKAIDANWPTANYTMLREALTLAKDALRSLPAPPDDELPMHKRKWTSKELVEAIQHGIATARMQWICPHCDRQSAQVAPPDDLVALVREWQRLEHINTETVKHSDNLIHISHAYIAASDARKCVLAWVAPAPVAAPAPETPAPVDVPACPDGQHSYRRNAPPQNGDVCFVCRKSIWWETPAPDAMPEKRGHQIVARDRDGMPWCETCRKWGVREDGPCDRTYPGSTGRRQEAQP